MNSIEKEIEKNSIWHGLSMNTVHHWDCLELMKLIPDKSIDLVLTDPPYFWIVKDDWDNQRETRQHFIEWLEECTKERKRILKDNGSLYVFWDDKVIAYVQVMMDKYFKLENNIVIDKWKSYITSIGRNVFNSYATITERILFYSNENGKDAFKSIKDYFRTEYNKTWLSHDAINKLFWTTSKWGWWMSYNILSINSSIFNMPKEEYYVKLQSTWFFNKSYEEITVEYELAKRTFTPYCNYTDIWRFNRITSTENSKSDHPTQKPIDIVKRIIDTSSKEWDIVLDCFLWSWTTAIACKELWRNFIGIEKEQKYVDIANKRLETTTVSLFL